MRRFARLLPLLAILALIAAAAFVLLRAGPVADHIRKVVQTELSQQLDRPVSIRSAALTLTGGVELRDVVIKNKDGSVLLKAPVMQARVGGLGEMLKGGKQSIQVRSVRLDRPELNLARRADGSWSVSDLLGRTSKAPGRFGGVVTANDARIMFVDEARGGQVTVIENTKVTFRQPTQQQVSFTVRAGANKGMFDSFELRGESDSAKKTTELTGNATRLSVPFAVERIPNLTALTAAAGTADVKGTLSIGGEPGGPQLTYDVNAEVSETEVSFPWLRRPAKGVAGKLRLAGGDLQLDGIAGTIEDAPVEVNGTISDLTTRVPAFSLDLSVNGIRYPQLRALFPRAALPAGLLLPSAMRVEAKIEGPADQIKVSGEATVKVIKFHAIPWHDLVGRFEYQDGKLKIGSLKAHGSPRQFEADIEIDLKHGLAAQGNLQLANMPLSMLAEMAGIKGEFRGVARANVRGVFRNGAEMRGDFVVDGAAAQGVDLGRLQGEFVYSDGGVVLRRVRIVGPTADGMLDATISLSGSYKLTAQLVTLDLTKLGPMVKLQGLQGRCCARIEASGQVKAGQATARIKLGPGELQGRPFDSLSANLAMTRDRVTMRDLVLATESGQFQGGLTISGWRGPPGGARISGRVDIAGVALKDWLPGGYEGVAVEGAVSGAFDIAGTLAQPVAAGELHGESVSLGGRPFAAAKARFRYEKHQLYAEQIDLRSQDGSISVTGGYTPETGFALDLAAEQLDLTSITSDLHDWLGRIPKEGPRSGLRGLLGFDAKGQLNVHARVTGLLYRPEVRVSASAAPLDLNGVRFDRFSVSGRMLDGELEVSNGFLGWRDGSITVRGKVGAQPDRPVRLSAVLDRADLGSALLVGDTAVWRLYESDRLYQTELLSPLIQTPFFKRYAALPRPLKGRLSGTVDCSGTLAETQLGATVNLADFGFDDREIQQIAGTLHLTLGMNADRQVALHQAEVDMKATQGETEITFGGSVTADGIADLSVDAGNFDLSVLNAWLHPPAELAGEARIDFDITGPVATPVIRGGVFADKLQLGPFSLEAVSADPVWLKNGVLTVDDLRARKGAMEATGKAEVPVTFGGLAALARAELHVRDASVEPVKGMMPAQFDGDLYLVGGTLYLQDGEGPGGSAPGIRGTLGSGTFLAGGSVNLGRFVRGEWQPAYHVTADFDRAQVSIPGLFDVKVTGSVALKNGPDGRALITDGQGGTPPKYDAPLAVSDGTVTLEQTHFVKSGIGGIFAPALDVRLVVGDNVWFQRGSGQRPTRILIDPSRTTADGSPMGYLDVGGTMRAPEVTLNGEFESHQGRLVFPNGVLTLRSGTAQVTRDVGKKPVIMVTAEAEGRVGDYLVSLSPSGQIYPEETTIEGGTTRPNLALNLRSLPQMEEAYVMALLTGPIVAPTLGARSDITSLLAEPTGGGASSGQITGIRVPALGNALGMQEFSLDLGLTGPVRLRVGQRVLKRLVISYASALSGPVESRTLSFNYEVTPRYSLGWAVNELNQGRFQVDAFIPF